ncbi:MAG TPA: SCO family protein [Fimbriimonadales bacterium]|nr:SCO family protein [Fimbriimonadales bacterium]
MKSLFSSLLFALCLSISFSQAPPPSIAEKRDTTEKQQTMTSGVTIEQHLDEQLPLDTVFFDENGKEVPLATFFGERPVILGLVYYRCPALCNRIITGIIESLKVVSFDAGKEFDVVLISIDPTESPELAAETKQSILKRYDRPQSENGWHLLVGSQESILSVADTVGFRYKYDPVRKQYVHAAGIFVITPQGKISQYFYGIEYPPRDLRLALVQSAENKIGTLVDQVLLYCMVYDPATGKYGLAILRLVQLAGLVTVIALGIFIYRMFRQEPKEVIEEIVGEEPFTEKKER